jgi:hypothetical protein
LGQVDLAHLGADVGRRRHLEDQELVVVRGTKRVRKPEAGDVQPADGIEYQPIGPVQVLRLPWVREAVAVIGGDDGVGARGRIEPQDMPDRPVGRVERGDISPPSGPKTSPRAWKVAPKPAGARSPRKAPVVAL